MHNEYANQISKASPSWIVIRNWKDQLHADVMQLVALCIYRACEKTKNIHINMLGNLLLIAPKTVSINNYRPSSICYKVSE